MRLHTLEITAFGPFGDTTRVDFDALSAAGLFLLSGATGAGKSSVLDAVCFALYGDVPGDRAEAKRLRSDLADPAVATRVVLEATLSGRRFRFTRSPAWQRPKKRGTGLTTEQASVVVAEWVHDAWVSRSTRLDEAGHLIGDLVGLTLDQFCQVALLPQGRFQAFLRARSEERQRLLSRLFRTDRFARVEGWLTDHRLALRSSSEQHRRVVAALVQRISETTGATVPDDWQGEGLTRDCEAGLVAPWLDDLVETGRQALADASARSEATDETLRAASEALAEAQTLTARQRALRTATETAERLSAETPLHEERLARHSAALRSRAVVPLVDLEADARERLTVAEEHHARHLALARAAGADPASLAVDRDIARRDAAAAAELGRAEAELTGHRRTLEEHAERRATLLAELTDIDEGLASLPAQRASAAEELAQAQQAAVLLSSDDELLTRARARLTAALQVDELGVALVTARADQHEAVDRLHRAKDAWFDLREARLHGMAAEIAGSLVVGGCCPVCGSADHPQPARALPGAPDSEAERTAQAVVDDAEAERHVRDEVVRDLETRHVIAEREAGGLAAADASEQVGTLEATREAHLRAVAATPALATRLDALTHRGSTLAERRERLRQEDLDLAAAERHLRRELATLAERVQAVLQGSPDPDLTSRTRRLGALADACQAALDATHARGQAQEEHERTVAALTAALHDHGFDDAAAAGAARLSEAELSCLAEAIGRRVEEQARVSGVLADPDIVLAAEQPAPDLTALETAASDAHRAAREATSAAGVAVRSERRLSSLAEQLRPALAAWAPVRESLAVATALSAFVDGKSADNRLQMRLSAYVLSWRLSQVVDAANLRLGPMSDQRYALEHTPHRGAGERRGGLSLLVRDDWSGQTRDPATLSGGEVFVVSLSLALGLADVITQESGDDSTGDTRLETLFVDEGFGSLDADTLDDVLATLDSLREGGRVVGVVSHVAEMRDRIPARLEVVKHPTGSRLRSTAQPVG